MKSLSAWNIVIRVPDPSRTPRLVAQSIDLWAGPAEIVGLERAGWRVGMKLIPEGSHDHSVGCGGLGHARIATRRYRCGP